jgi:hypothetical protein
LLPATLMVAGGTFIMPGVWPMLREAGVAAAFGFEGVDREALVVQATGVGHKVLAAAQERFIQVSTMSKVSGACTPMPWVQAAGWVPGLVAHTGHKFAHGAGALHGQGAAVAGDDVAAFVQAASRALPCAPVTSPHSGRCHRVRLLRPSHARAPAQRSVRSMPA